MVIRFEAQGPSESFLYNTMRSFALFHCFVLNVIAFMCCPQTYLERPPHSQPPYALVTNETHTGDIIAPPSLSSTRESKDGAKGKKAYL